jgi:hypothetical protein
LRFCQNHPPGWCYVRHTIEHFIKYQQDWPINIKRHQKEEEEKKTKSQQEKDEQEPELEALLEAGLITPNELYYVRNHSHVPHILWETHKVDVENGRLIMSMDNLASGFEPINIAVALACDRNRRKELNTIRRSKGLQWYLITRNQSRPDQRHPTWIAHKATSS